METFKRNLNVILGKIIEEIELSEKLSETIGGCNIVLCQDCNSSILQFSVHNCLYLLSKGVFKNSLHNVCRKTRNLLFMKKSRDINFLKKQIDFTKFHPEELVHSQGLNSSRTQARLNVS